LLSAEIAIQIALRMRVRVREYSNGVRGKISACRFFSFFCYFFFQEVVSSLFFCVWTRSIWCLTFRLSRRGACNLIDEWPFGWSTSSRAAVSSRSSRFSISISISRDCDFSAKLRIQAPLLSRAQHNRNHNGEANPVSVSLLVSVLAWILLWAWVSVLASSLRFGPSLSRILDLFLIPSPVVLASFSEAIRSIGTDRFKALHRILRREGTPEKSI